MRNPLTLEAFADFCESKNPRETYEYMCGNSCACAQYYEQLGLEYSPVEYINDDFEAPFLNQIEALAHNAALEKPHWRGTFGELARLTRQRIADRNFEERKNERALLDA